MTRSELRIVGDYLWDRTFTRTVDRLTSEQFKIPSGVLMELAGRGVAQVILDAGVEDAPVVVLAGSGNNGGDALVAARWLAEAGCEVHVFLVPRGEPSELCAAQLATLKALGHAAETYSPGCLAPFAGSEPIIVDGVLGLGFSGSLDDASLQHQALAEAALIPVKTVVAVDLPSGLDADSGEHQQVPLRADVTVTFGGKKPAHVLSPARDAAGEVLCLDIGFPAAAQDAALAVHTPPLVQPDPDELLAIDPWGELPKSAHKYDRGHVLIIGGSAGKTGAPLLAGMSALRAGAGWVTIAMPDSATLTLRGDVPRELVFEPLFDGEDLNPIALETFLEERKVRAVVAGPGAVQNPLTAETLAVLADFSAEHDGFVLLDAGATHAVAPLLAGLDLEPERWLLTPHPGEWRQLGSEFDISPLTPVGFKRASGLADRLGVALLYKHATPVLLTGNPKTPGFVVAEGTVALARAGSGDVLAGVAGAHGAIGLSSVVAALRSQVLVAWAARLAEEERGRHGVLARDIMEQLGNAAALAEAGEDSDEIDDNEEDGGGGGRRH